MARIDGWDTRLMETISRHQALAYAPGRVDCFVLACDIVEALTGARPYADVRYSTDAGAVRAMQKRGFSRLGDAMAAVLQPRANGHAQRGDIAVIATDSRAGDTLGIVLGGVIAVRIGQIIKQRPLGAARLILATE